jgi:four helix bundle protein
MDREELKARTRKFALDVIRLCLTLGRDDFAQLVRPQLLRAATGIAANYRAACRGRSRKEFIAKIGVVVEESDEAELWLDIVQELGYGTAAVVRELRLEATELRAIFAASRATAICRQQDERAARKTSRPKSGDSANAQISKSPNL